MTVTAGVTSAEPESAATRRRGRSGARVLAAGLVALAVSPIVVGALSLVGDTWYPAGDWGHFVYRVSQVGTSETPLVGSYTVKGWAHPGPLGFWSAAPLYRLTGGDPRSLQWTAAVVNIVVLGALAAVAWRRGRWPMLLGVLALVALLVRGIGPAQLVDLWNPYLPLTSFLLTVFLAWDAALGRRRALLEAVLPASLAMQSHLAFVSLVGLLAVWLFAWMRWWPRLLVAHGDETVDPGNGSGTDAGGGDAGRTGDGDHHSADPAANGDHRSGPERLGDETADLPGPPWTPWFRTVRKGLLFGGVLWLAPLADAAFDLHNPWNIAKSFGSGAARVGLVQAVGLVGRFVRPDGPWMGGPEPLGNDFFSVQGSGALPVVVALGVLAACIQVARRRGLVDVAALGTLSLALVLGAIPASAQLPLPNESYLTQWLKIVGGLVWFTAAWTVWRLVEPAARKAPMRRVAGVAVAGGVVVAAAASTWGEASSIKLPLNNRGDDVQELWAQLDGRLPRDETIRIARRGEFFHVYAAGLTYVMIDEGYDVVTDEGRSGLKWGHAHRWSRGEPYDRLLTVAVNQAFNQCAERPGTEQLASYDGLSPEDRAWLTDVQFRRLDGPDAVSPAEQRRADAMARDDVRIGVFESARPCATDRDTEITRTSDSSILPVAGGTAVLVLGVVGGRAWRRRRDDRRRGGGGPDRHGRGAAPDGGDDDSGPEPAAGAADA
ncbi:MAG: hypothetical protein ACRD2C_03880 [Acidimicrobiales bacterium]